MDADGKFDRLVAPGASGSIDHSINMSSWFDRST